VDTLGLLLAVVITGAGVDDAKGAPPSPPTVGRPAVPAVGGGVGRLEVPQPRLQRLEGPPRGTSMAVGSGQPIGGDEMLRALGEAVGGGANVRLAGASPVAEPRLRMADDIKRMYGPRPRDSGPPQPHGPEILLYPVQIQSCVESMLSRINSKRGS
jgi:hypothetical protein